MRRLQNTRSALRGRAPWRASLPRGITRADYPPARALAVNRPLARAHARTTAHSSEGASRLMCGRGPPDTATTRHVAPNTRGSQSAHQRHTQRAARRLSHTHLTCSAPPRFRQQLECAVYGRVRAFLTPACASAPPPPLSVSIRSLSPLTMCSLHVRHLPLCAPRTPVQPRPRHSLRGRWWGRPCRRSSAAAQGRAPPL